MKYLLSFLVMLYCVAASACDCGPSCTCDPCECKTGAAVRLPNDGSKLTVTVFAENELQAKLLVNKYPQIKQYKAGNHYNVYTKANQLTGTRFAGVKMPSAIVQTASGATVWSTDANCIFRNRCNPQPKPAPVDEVDDEDEEPTPAEPDLAPWAMLALAALGVAAGAGSKLYEDLKSV